MVLVRSTDLDGIHMAPGGVRTIPDGNSSESVQYAMLKACDACADMGQL